MNPDAVAAYVVAVIMVVAIFLGGIILMWWLERKDRLEDDDLWDYGPYIDLEDDSQ